MLDSLLVETDGTEVVDAITQSIAYLGSVMSTTYYEDYLFENRYFFLGSEKSTYIVYSMRKTTYLIFFKFRNLIISTAGIDLVAVCHLFESIVASECPNQEITVKSRSGHRAIDPLWPVLKYVNKLLCQHPTPHRVDSSKMMATSRPSTPVSRLAQSSHEPVLGATSNVRVAIRVRPLNKRGLQPNKPYLTI